MEVQNTALSGVLLLTPKKFGDARGFFSEVYNREAAHRAGIDVDFVQDNQSRSELTGTVRGLHFQTPPFAQAKLVRVVRGSILDVAVDIRRGSPTYGRHVATILSAENWTQLYAPVGFAHGFVTLESNTEILYKVSAPYAPDHDSGIVWNDPHLAIAWQIPVSGPILSEKDKTLQVFHDFVSPFSYRA